MFFLIVFIYLIFLFYNICISLQLLLCDQIIVIPVIHYSKSLPTATGLMSASEALGNALSTVVPANMDYYLPRTLISPTSSLEGERASERESERERAGEEKGRKSETKIDGGRKGVCRGQGDM